MATRYYYDASKDDGKQAIYGVPRRDLTDDEYEALPEWVQARVKALPMYSTKNPNPQPKKASPDAVGRAEKPASDSNATGAADDTHDIDKGDKEA